MIKTYLKIGFRSILKNKGFYALNAGGLVIGLTAVLLISLWVHNELSFNKSLTNYKTIARVMQNQTFGGVINTAPNEPMLLAPVIRNKYGNYFEQVVTSTMGNNYNLSHNEKIVITHGNFAEPGLPNLLNLKMLSGTREALNDISSILISKSTAKTLFGNEDAMGKTLKLMTDMDVKVAGVYEDLPKNSSFNDLKFIAPWELLKKNQNYENRLGWGNNWFQVLVQLKDESALPNVSSLIKDIKKDNDENSANSELFLFPISKWHLYSKFENGVSVGGNIEYVTIFSIVGLFILLLACINFMNLSTAHALKRSKEVGVRKTLGSSRKQLILQFFTESLMLIVFSFCIALLLAFIVLPEFNTITLKEISIPFNNPVFWLVSLLLVVITAILSSFYPSLYLSAFKPVKVLKGLSSNSKGTVTIRKTLIVVQFTISIILIIGTLTVVNQINYVKDRPLGFNKELLLSVPINNDNVLESFGSIRNELLEASSIDQVAASDVKITSTYTTNGGFQWKGKDPNFHDSFYTLRSTLGFGKMVDWKILEGRDFSEAFKSDSLAFLINETAAKYMNLENPVGEYVKWGDNGSFQIIGVVKDMVTRSPFDPIVPSIYTLHYGDFLNYVNIKIASGANIESAISTIQNVFQKHDPESLFTYSFLDDEYQQKFNAEKRIAKLTALFSLVAILISCLGVLGLSTYMAIQRRKEIGIRKVLGASVHSIWQLLSKQFMILVIVSLAIAIPIGYYFSSQWLMKYNYHINMSFWIFALAGGIILAITLLTVSFQSIKAALSNPTNSLRTE